MEREGVVDVGISTVSDWVSMVDRTRPKPTHRREEAFFCAVKRMAHFG